MNQLEVTLNESAEILLMYSRVWGLEHVLTRIHENTCLYVLGTI